MAKGKANRAKNRGGTPLRLFWSLPGMGIAAPWSSGVGSFAALETYKELSENAQGDSHETPRLWFLIENQGRDERSFTPLVYASIRQGDQVTSSSSKRSNS